MNETYSGFGQRAAQWQRMTQGEPYDVIIVGGGITGAGVLREAVRRGYRALLLEQQDFAWGTSSRSSKMVHGGLRYLGQGDVTLTRDSLTERERLLQEAPGLIERMGYYFTLRKGQFPGRFAFGLVLAMYDWLAGIKNHHFVSNAELAQQFAGVKTDALNGAMYYTDTVTDDARLVLRVLQESLAAGGEVLNYARVVSLLQEDEQVVGVTVEDGNTGEQLVLRSASVISATGAWADELRGEVNVEKRIRPLRGSHLVVPAESLPCKDALTLFHPVDKRPVFVFPWEGTTVIGTTDLDHRESLNQEPAISREEVDYLLEAVATLFPEYTLSEDQVLSTWSGVRPVIGSERTKDPSKERRDHAVWSDRGLVTVSGGKLTTFRRSALDALAAAKATLPPAKKLSANDRVFAATSIAAESLGLQDAEWAQRLLGRYGDVVAALLAAAPPEEWVPIGGSQYCLAECRWAAHHEAVMHLDDLLLRRTRLGAVLPNGGAQLFAALETLCAEEMGWDAPRWTQEQARYEALWQRSYSLP